jgi:hypothetical protein
MNFKLNLSAQASTFSFLVNIIICHLFTPPQIEIFSELILPANAADERGCQDLIALLAIIEIEHLAPHMDAPATTWH